MDIANGFVAEIAPTEPDGVYSGVGYGIAAGFDVGRYIFVDERTSLYHHMCADVAELMNEAKNQAKDRQRGERKNPQEKRQPRKREW